MSVSLILGLVGVLPLSVTLPFILTPTLALTLTPASWPVVGPAAIGATSFGILVWGSIALVLLIFLYLVRALATDRQSS